VRLGPDVRRLHVFAPTFESHAWLVDMHGRVCRHWDLEIPPASHGKLLPNGHVMWQGKGPDSMKEFVGSGSVLKEVDWDGREVWRHEQLGLNHDFVVLENGNLIVNVYVPMSEEDSRRVQGGLPGTELHGRMWTCRIQEITRAGEAVWQHDLADLLDPATDLLCPLCPRHVWGFNNSLWPLPDGNVLLTLRLLNDLAVLDPEEGALVWRFGRDQELGHPHSCSALPNGHYLLFDNGLHRAGADPNLQIADISASRVIEIDPQTKEIVWQYLDPFAPNFYSAICSSAQGLPNENVLICEATKGRLFEVTRDKDIVWDYHSPFLVTRPNYWGWTLAKTIWDAQRYAPDHPGLRDKDLDPDRYEWALREKSEEASKEAAALARLRSLGY
jgi:hypothetical protein